MSVKRTKFHYTFSITHNIATIYEDDRIICKDMLIEEETLDKIIDLLNELVTKCHMLEKENRELNSIKKFAEKNGINIFLIEEAFRKCWKDNGKLFEENKYLKKRIKVISDELYCKDRKLEELGVPIECCDKK